jgi:hypothetical protein
VAHPHGYLPIPVHAEVFGGVNRVSFASAAFDPVTTPRFVQSQFSNLLAGLLAVGGWLGGDAMLLRVNPLLAGAAPARLYGVARQYVERAWALVPVAVLSVSAPMLHFGRIAYSNPVTMLFLLGRLALLREAQRRGRAGGYAWPAWCSAQRCSPGWSPSPTSST